MAGYTHAGQSSLFYALTEEEVAVDTTLFTTLSTTTRLAEFSRKECLLTDTVGLVDRLPLTLIEAFHSTLEETIYSDLILLVVDVIEPLDLIERKLSIFLETIELIGASSIPIITALNKIDLSEKETQRELMSLKEKTPNAVSRTEMVCYNHSSTMGTVLSHDYVTSLYVNNDLWLQRYICSDSHVFFIRTVQI